MSTQTHAFQAEVAQLLHLVTHSLYSNKEIFLRELVSNASDACDKLRYEALNQTALFEDAPNLEIRVFFDKQARTLTIADNGIGMSRQEAIDHLGTIAKSGTRDFMSRLNAEQKSDAQDQGALIGQFGVGFYSGYIVADQITVELSYGRKRALEIATTLALDPEMLLLDEPMAGMGTRESEAMVHLLKGLKGQYTMLLVEHDMDAVFRLADRISVLVNGRVIATGEPEAIRINSEVKKAYLGDEATA